MAIASGLVAQLCRSGFRKALLRVAKRCDGRGRTAHTISDHVVKERVRVSPFIVNV